LDEEDGCIKMVIELLRSIAGQPATDMHRTDFQHTALCVEEEADAQTRLFGLGLGWVVERVERGSLSRR
jgi:hypothetical protein